MADTLPTLLDVAKSTGSDGLAGLVEQVVHFVPEISLLPVKPVKGTRYETPVRVALPTVGFRDANEGAAANGSRFEKRVFSCHILNPVWVCDKAVAEAHEDGAAAYIAQEGLGMTTAAFVTVGKQIFYGVGNDSKGFPGLPALYDPTQYELDATGSTANGASSVWFVRFGIQGVQLAMGNNAQMTLSDLKEIIKTDTNGNSYTAYHQEILSWTGLISASVHAAGRICNLTTQNGKGLTDSLLGDMLSRFPVGHTPDAIFMSRRSREQLRDSRTATNATGAEAPTPTTFEGVPIVATDSIVNTEPIVA